MNAYYDPRYPVELGASIFVEVNSILVNATKEFNLSTDPFIPDTGIPGPSLAVWNGQELVLTQNGGNSWWDLAKLLWKYGLAPVRTMRLVKSVVGKFLKMYDEPAFPFESLTQVAQDLGLLAVSAATGEQYLEENGITGPFVGDVIQASTRVNYAQNLNYIHGVEAMVSMAAENARSIRGGNWQIFDGMIRASNATAVLQTAVMSIEKRDTTFEVNFSSTAAHEEISASRSFDAVILACPFQFSDISIYQSADQQILPDAVPYVELHVTLFASPHLLSSDFFNLKPDEPAPRVILTTLPKTEQRHTGPKGVGSPGFFSISLLNPVKNPKTGGQEYLYKIFSAEPPNATFLEHLLGLEQSKSGAISDEDITWIFSKVWNSYPYEYPRVTFEKIQLDDGLWYTSGMDSFISTMETNALMGMNVARLIIDDWMEKENKRAMIRGMREPSAVFDPVVASTNYELK